MILKRESILILLLLVLPAVRNSAGQKTNVADFSVLNSGSWTRVAVTKTGLYRLSYSDLQSIGISDPASVSVYANNQGQLSFYNDGKAQDDLKRVAVKMETGSDNTFGEGDYLIFYGEATHRWNYNSTSGKYEFSRHHYCDTAFYFITSKPGDALNVTTYSQPVDAPDYTSSSYDALYRYENESANLLGSGREWYQPATTGITNTINPGFNNLVTSEKITYKVRVLGRSGTQVTFSFKQGSQVVQTISPAVVNMSDQNGMYASVAAYEGTVLPASESPTFSLIFSNSSNISARGWIDYVDLVARARSKYTSGQMAISDTRSVGPDKVTEFIVSSQSPAIVWDVTDPLKPMQVTTHFLNSEISFTAASDSLRRYILFSQSSLLSPILLRDHIANQSLHSRSAVGMVIVTHPSFRRQADRLAEIHSRNDGLTSLIVTPQEIYNEYSGGTQDAAAIRNFVRMIYMRGKGTGTPLKYLLLFGDGSYQNKIHPPGNPNYVPTWQSVNSNTGVLSFTSDDFYGLLEDGEGEADGYLDIGIGRFPVADTADARIMVDKVERYISASAFGSWRNTLCLVADDEDNNLHMNDAENLSLIVASEAEEITTDKIYLDAYRQVSSISGNTYPDATRAINNRIESGCLVLNYVGHGSETGLAHEKVVKTDDIKSWSNDGMLPLFITATCEFSRFDNVTINESTGAITANTSAGEMILLNPEGGGIALMSTTRVVYSAPNYTLNSNIFRFAFDTAPDGSSMRLGDIIMNAKINSGSGTNKRNFLLLGDPALKLAWPKNGTVVTDSINSVSIENETDTLKALSAITVSGHIQSVTGSHNENFNGIIEAAVYDKEATVTTLANDGGSTMSYSVPGNIIFKGVTTVINGDFTFSFIVPLDIDYTYGKGRITYYAYNDAIDVNGSFDDITVGGFSTNGVSDTSGPLIKLFMNDTLFKDGDITDTAPTLLAMLSDESGINVSGTGIGHDVVAWIDGNTAESIVLNSLYKGDKSGVSSGSLSCPLSVSEEGSHTLTLRAWDNLNNFSQVTLKFIVNTTGAFTLTNHFCYPNPAADETNFSITHNRPDENIDITITIFNGSGEVIRVLKQSSMTGGYKIPDIKWDCCTESGSRAAGGVYVWKAEARTSSGENASVSQRVVIL